MKKRNNLVIMSIVLVAVLVVGVTLAYLTAMSNEKTNTFTVGKNISIALAEPAWDNLDFAGADAGITDDLGKDLAQNILPGRSIPKDPKVKNTSDDPVWVAIKLDYTGDAASFAAIDDFTNIDFKGTWEEKAGSNKTIFYYETILDAQGGTNDVTDDLFTRVLIDAGVSHATLKDFQIDIKAYAVQAEGLTLAQAKAELDALMVP